MAKQLFLLALYLLTAPVFAQTIMGCNTKAPFFGKAKCQNMNLQGADFSGVKIDSIDFSRSDLRRSKFTGILKNSVFDGANLEGADLSRVTEYFESTFINSNLQDAKLPAAPKAFRSDFNGANLEGASYQLPEMPTPNIKYFDPLPLGAWLTNLTWFDGTRCTDTAKTCDPQINRIIFYSYTAAPTNNTVCKDQDMTELKLYGHAWRNGHLKNSQFDSSTFENMGIMNFALDKNSFVQTNWKNVYFFVESAVGDCKFITGDSSHSWVRDCAIASNDFSKAIFENVQLPWTVENNFSGATFNKVTAQMSQRNQYLNAKISDSHLANASSSKFANATLKNTIITSCEFCNFSNAVLENVEFGSPLNKVGQNKFKNMDLRGAKIKNLIIAKEADLSESFWINGNKCAKGSIGRCIEESVAVNGVTMNDGADASNKDFENISFQKLSLKNSNFSNSNLANAKFIETNLENALFNQANLNKTIFAKINLKNSSFVGAKLLLTDFQGANLEGANFREAKMLRTIFINANLINSNIDQLYCTKCDFTGATWVDGNECLEGSIGFCQQ